MNPVIITFLGSRGPYAGSDELPAVVIRFGRRVLLLDAGEGVQHRLMDVGVSVAKVSTILITHMHGDHILGLIPLIQSRSLSNVRKELTIVGPRGLREYLEANFKMLKFTPCFDVIIHEVDKGCGDLSIGGLRLSYLRLDHDIDTYGYLINVGGNDEVNICYVTDTRPISLNEYFTKCKILIHDSTFLSYDRDLAINYGHSTAADAAKAAIDVNAEMLLLFHMSPRYRDLELFEAEARRYFRFSYVAKKFTKVFIK